MKQQIGQRTQGKKAGSRTANWPGEGDWSGEGVGLIYGTPAKEVGPHCFRY